MFTHPSTSTKDKGKCQMAISISKEPINLLPFDFSLFLSNEDSSF